MQYKEKVIGIDCDGVLRDFPGDLINTIKEYYPEYIKETDIPEQYLKITDWHLENNFNCSLKDLQQIYRHDYAKEILENGTPIGNNVEIMKELIEWGDELNYEFWCITSQIEQARHHTLSWLGKHKLNFHRVIFEMGADKWELDIDWLVDDSPVNWSAWKKGRGDDKNYILMDAPYNQHIEPYYRITDLAEVEDIQGYHD